jgi:hypothetical protein
MYDLNKLRIGDRLVCNKGYLANEIGIYLGRHFGQHIIAQNSKHYGLIYVNFIEFLKGNKLERIDPFVGNDNQRHYLAVFIESNIRTFFDLKQLDSFFHDTSPKTKEADIPNYHLTLASGKLQYVWYRKVDLFDHH